MLPVPRGIAVAHPSQQGFQFVSLPMNVANDVVAQLAPPLYNRFDDVNLYDHYDDVKGII
jgi:hypothetical protein